MSVPQSISSIGEYRTCKRRFYYKYVERIRPVSSGRARSVGSLIHLGLEAYDNGATLKEAINQMDEAATGGFWDEDEAQIELHRAAGVIHAYFDKWGEDRAIYEAIEVEGEFRVPVGDHSLIGKRDVVWRLKKTGEFYLVERKTTSEEISTVGADYWQRLALDTQITGYQHALEHQLGESVSVLYDVLRKPGGRPKMKSRVAKRKRETPEEYEARKAEAMESLAEFQSRMRTTTLEEDYLVRRPVHRTREQHLGILDEMEETLGEMAGYSGSYPRNDQACRAKWGTCPYLGVCAGVESLDSPKFERRESTHTELSQDNQKQEQEDVYGFAGCPI